MFGFMRQFGCEHQCVRGCEATGRQRLFTSSLGCCASAAVTTVCIPAGASLRAGGIQGVYSSMKTRKLKALFGHVHL